MAKIKSFGAIVYINGIAVGGLTDISASGTEVNFVDSTSHDTAGGFKTFLSGLKDGGTLELTGKYNYADSGQAEWKAEEGVSHAFYIILTDSSGLAFNAIVGGFQTSNPLDDAVEFTATARITGPVYPVFPRITVTGTLTSNGSTPVTLGYLTIDGYTEDRLLYAGFEDTLERTSGSWVLTDSATGAKWTTTNDALTPDRATGWTPVGAATGTPILTGS